MKVIVRKETKSTRGRGKTLVWGVHDFPPIGKILVALSAEGLCWLGVNCGIKSLKDNWPGAECVEDAAVTAPVACDIARRWPRSLDALSVPVVLCGTEFQIKVWKALLRIKPGAPVTYAAVAKKIGKPRAVRAVGSAVGSNPVSIVVPCHRVVNKDAQKINYGWGVKVKKALLAKEKESA